LVVTIRTGQARRPHDEGNGEMILKIRSIAEREVWAKDRGRHGLNDFWAGDVAGLYRDGLIPRERSEADPAPLVPLVHRPAS